MLGAPLETYEHIEVSSGDGIALVTMNRPHKRNALSLAHMRELIDAFRRIGADRRMRVAILRGAGPAFCAGHDLTELVGASAHFLREVFDTCTQLMDTIQSIPQPVIAQVHGVATAAGCQLVATCDVAVAGNSARFATPGVNIGLFCSTPMVAVSRVVGRKKAMEMLLTGEPISAQEALVHGLVSRVVPDEELEAETRRLAEKIASASSYVVALGKQAFYRQVEMPQQQAYAYTKEVMTLNSLAHDAQEGMCAFLEKRRPSWKDA
ncbi:MAG: enoyl-CoA hydratase [Firmicutes bacterium]|nr:enoyl-CoA hydratase [Bacillota bacterium]